MKVFKKKTKKPSFVLAGNHFCSRFKTHKDELKKSDNYNLNNTKISCDIFLNAIRSLLCNSIASIFEIFELNYKIFCMYNLQKHSPASLYQYRYLIVNLKRTNRKCCKTLNF